MKTVSLLMLLCCWAQIVHAGDAEQVFERVGISVVTITTLDERNQIDGEGSGVVIGPEQVVTNCHVVNEANLILVYAAGKKFAATLVSGNIKRDLCLLQVAELKAPAVKIRSSEDLTKGEPVYAVGNPLGFGLSVSSGLVSTINRSQGETQVFTSAPISPGSSGGGLFDSKGRLVGITTRLYFGAQNLNMALPAEWVNDLAQKGLPLKIVEPMAPDPDWNDTAESLHNSGDWGKLLEWTRRWRKVWPTSSVADYYLAIALFKTNKVQEAEQALNSALEKNPRDANALSYLSMVHDSLGDKKAAYEDLQRAQKLQPSLGYGYRLLADWQKADGNLDEAITSIETSLRLTPWDCDSWEVLGELRQGKRQYHEAEEAYRTVLRLKPDYPTASSNLASVLAYLGKAEAARRALPTNSDNQSNAAQTWLNIGVAEDKKQRFREAEHAYRKALDLDSHQAGAWQALGGVLLRSNRTKEAEDAFRQAVKFQPALGISWFNLGNLLRDRGDKEEAKIAYEKATSAEPGGFGAWYNLGLLLHDQGNLSLAATVLETASRLDPTKSDVWAILGETQIRLDRDEDGFRSLQKAEKIDPKNETTMQGLSMYFGRRKDYDRSIFYIERALEINSASANSWSNKGYSLLKLKRYTEAGRALETAVRLQPDFANAWINLGETYLRQNQAGKAIVTLEKALQLAPAAADARFYAGQAYAGTGQYAKAQVHIEKLLQLKPQFPDALIMQTVIFIQQNKKLEALSAYSKLKALNPNRAKELRERLGHGSQPFDLPD
jgi:tetratricopeptide (TPR) repeat protein